MCIKNTYQWKGNICVRGIYFQYIYTCLMWEYKHCALWEKTMSKIQIQTKNNYFTKGCASFHTYWKAWCAHKDEKHLNQLNKQSANSSLTKLINQPSSHPQPQNFIYILVDDTEACTLLYSQLRHICFHCSHSWLSGPLLPTSFLVSLPSVLEP